MRGVAINVRRIVDDPATRLVLLMAAGAQALIGAFIIGLAVNVGTSGGLGGDGGGVVAPPPVTTPLIVTEPPVPLGPFPRVTGPVLAGVGVPEHMVLAPDGALWFSQVVLEGDSVIGRLGSNGALHRFPTTIKGRIATGPMQRVVSVYDLTGRVGASAIAAAADGNLWVAGAAPHSIARVTPGGQVTQYTLGPDRYPDLLVAGKDGTLWLSIRAPSGSSGVVRFPLPR